MMTPVDELYAITDAPESEDDEILLLKFVKSVARRHPKVDVFAVLQVMVLVVRVRPVLNVSGTS